MANDSPYEMIAHAFADPHGWMAEHERELDFELAHPGEVPWLPADDWPPDVIVSRRGREVRIVAIHARHPGAGAGG
jgi:hypothetical protein